MVIRNKFDCPWCSKTEKAFTGDGGEYALKEHAKEEHEDLWKFYQRAIEEWKQDMDEKIENEDSITTNLKLRMMKHLGKGSPKPRDVQRAYKTVKK